MGKKSTPTPPDLGPTAASSEQVAQIQQQTALEQLAWAREQDDRNQGVLQSVLDTQLPIMQETADQARSDRQRYETQFQPLEDNLINEFQNYDSPERQASERGRAVSDMTQAFDAQRKNALSRLEGYGVDPSQTRNAALDIGVRTQQAAAQAGAASQATRNTENTGRALRAEAINIGKGLPSQVAASYGQSIAAGNSGVGNANATTAGGANALTSGNGAMGQALQGYGQSANIQSQGFGNQMQAYQAQQQANQSAIQGIGQVAGMAAMFMRDGGDVPRRTALPPKKEGLVNEGPSDGSGIDDQVPAKLSVGEYVVPADVVAVLGTRYFDKLKEKYHTPAAEQEDGHANGGMMGFAPQQRAIMGVTPQGTPMPNYMSSAIKMNPRATAMQMPATRPQPMPMMRQPMPVRGMMPTRVAY
jgi:hypothetical protein